MTEGSRCGNLYGFGETAAIRIRPAHSMPRDYGANVAESVCPRCGKARPLDWYKGGRVCWKCRQAGRSC